MREHVTTRRLQPPPEEATMRDWCAFTCRYVEVPAWRCVVCRARWSKGAPAEHHDGCEAEALTEARHAR